MTAPLPGPDLDGDGRGPKAGPGASARYRLVVGLVGAFVASAVVVAVVAVGFLVVVLPAERSASIPGLIDLDRTGDSFVVQFGPLLLILPIIGALVLGPFVAAVLGKLQARRRASSDAA